MASERDSKDGGASFDIAHHLNTMPRRLQASHVYM